MKYIIIRRGNCDVYFNISRIDKKISYRAHGNTYYDYDVFIIIDYKNQYEPLTGKFLCVDKSKDNDIIIYDNENDQVINVGYGSENEEVSSIMYHFNGREIGGGDSLEYVVKEILFDCMMQDL